MRANEMPVNGDRDPEWNKFRARIIAALQDIELWLAATKRGINTDVYAYELANRLGVTIEDDLDFSTAKLWLSLLPIARANAKDSIEQDGQLTLFPGTPYSEKYRRKSAKKKDPPSAGTQTKLF